MRTEDNEWPKRTAGIRQTRMHNKSIERSRRLAVHARRWAAGAGVESVLETVV